MNIVLMQEIKSMDSQAEESSRETQLQQETIRLQKENENLLALNISLQKSIIFLYLYFSVYPSIYQFICQCGCLLVITFNFIIIIIFKSIIPMLESMSQNIALGTDTLNNQKSQENSSHKNPPEKVNNKNVFVHIYIYIFMYSAVQKS